MCPLTWHVLCYHLGNSKTIHRPLNPDPYLANNRFYIVAHANNHILGAECRLHHVTLIVALMQPTHIWMVMHWWSYPPRSGLLFSRSIYYSRFITFDLVVSKMQISFNIVLLVVDSTMILASCSLWLRMSTIILALPSLHLGHSCTISGILVIIHALMKDTPGLK